MFTTPATLNDFLSSLDDRAHVLSLPLRVKFRGITRREVMLVRGPRGWVEFAPFVEYGPQESSRWLRSALYSWGDATEPAPGREDNAPRDLPSSVEVNATIPAIDTTLHVEGVEELMQRYPGCTTVKVKVAEPGVEFSTSKQRDVARVAAVRRYFADHGVPAPKIRVDANAGWTVEQAVDVLRELSNQGPLDYAEQPCATAEELAQVRMTLMREGRIVRIAADELIRKADDPLRVVKAGACDVAVVKVAPLGGADVVREIASEVSRYGVALTVSSALDSAVGIGAGLQAAAMLPRYHDDEGAAIDPQAAGLATGALFDVDVAHRPIVNGSMELGPVEPDPEVLERFAVPQDRRDWWIERARRAAEFL